MSALGDEIRAMIVSEGPITVERFMELALAHPDLGYYMNRDPFGARGRLHHRAGNFADVRRIARAVGRRGVVVDGLARSRFA